MSNGIQGAHIRMGDDKVEFGFGDDQEPHEVRISFGPHHDLRILEEDGEVRFRLVATHHGFEATASGEVPTELEEAINLIRKERQDLAID